MNSTTPNAPESTPAAARGSTAPKHRRRKRVVLVTVALALTVLLAPLVGTAIAKADPISGSTTSAVQPAFRGSRIDGLIIVDYRSQLELVSARMGSTTHTDRPVPLTVRSTKYEQYRYESNWATSAQLTVVYEIKGTPWVVWNHIYVPATGPNVIEAEVRRKGSDGPDPSAPFKAEARFRAVDPWDPQPELRVSAIR